MKRFLCEICKKNFSKAPNRDRHMKIHTGEKPFSCDICKKAFHQKENLKSHIRTHTGEKPYECDVCGRKFAFGSNFKEHIRLHQDEEKHYKLKTSVKKKKTFLCKVCQKDFSKARYRDRHMKVHTGNKEFSCNICKKAFSTKLNLKVHIRTHTGEKPYECYDCGRKFAHRTALKRHIEILHNKKLTKSRTNVSNQRCKRVKSFLCEICENSFTTNWYRNYHMKLHNGENNSYSCDTCESVFQKKGELQTHIRTHTSDKAEKLYECGICEAKFTTEQRLTEHTSDEHVFMKVEPEEPQVVEVKIDEEEHHVTGDARKPEQNVPTIADHNKSNAFMKEEPEEPQIIYEI